MNFEEYEAEKLSAIKEIEKAINYEFHLPVKIIHEEGAHPNSYRMIVNGIKWRMISWESMMYFKQENIDMLVDDLIHAMYQGDFLGDDYGSTNRNVFK